MPTERTLPILVEGVQHPSVSQGRVKSGAQPPDPHVGLCPLQASLCPERVLDPCPTIPILAQPYLLPINKLGAKDLRWTSALERHPYTQEPPVQKERHPCPRETPSLMRETHLSPRDPQSIVKTQITSPSLLSPDFHCLLQGPVMISWRLSPFTPFSLARRAIQGVGEVASTLLLACHDLSRSTCRAAALCLLVRVWVACEDRGVCAH